MKNSKSFHFYSEWKDWKKLLLIMKLSVLLLFFTCLQLSAVVSSQTVSLKVSDASLKVVLREINKQTGYQFFYDDNLLKSAGKVTLDLTDVPIDEALAQCFSNIPVDYEVIDNTIVLRPNTKNKIQDQLSELPQETLRLTGTVQDKNGVPLQAAAIIVKGTTIGTSTDEQGNFVLYCPVGSLALEISMLGMKTQEVMIDGKTSFSILLDEEAMGIDEVQIIAYGTTTKRLNTGSVSTVKGKQIETRPVGNIMQALQGQVTGLSVVNTNAGIGAPPTINVRGVNSLSSGTNPLVIIDGVIQNSSLGDLISSSNGNSTAGGANFYTSGVSVLNSINPNDIESIDVLKDADATAIYGSRGTNGVILITTKKASIGKTVTTASLSTGWISSTGTVKRMNTSEYLKMRRDAFATGNMTATSVINPITPTNLNAPDLLLWDTTAYTDYTEMEMGNTAPTYSADISMSGGTKALNFLTSANYSRIYDVYMDKPYQERLTGHISLNRTSENDRLKMNVNAIFGLQNQKFSQINRGATTAATNMNVPNYEIYNNDGTLNFATGKGYLNGYYFNPIPLTNMDVYSKTGNLMLSGDVSYEFIKNLVAKVQMSYGLQSTEYHNIFPTTAMSVQTDANYPVPTGEHTFNRYQSLNIEPQLTYTRKISKGSASALLGGTFFDKTQDRTGTTVTNPGSDDLLYSYSSGKPTSTGNSSNYNRFVSGFGRLNMQWDNKYLANFTFRRDGSSRFGPNNKFANFWSVGSAWIFSEESFIKDKLSFFSFGKIRGSYGTTGNDNISDYAYLSLLRAPTGTFSGMYQGSGGLNPSFPNPNIQWESTTKYDVGLELGFFNNRILLNGTYYHTLADNLLVALPLPGQTGFTNYTGNFVGTVQNTGFEFDLTTHNFSPGKKVQWITKLNISTNNNILKEFPDIESSTYAYQYEIGRAIPSSTQLEMPYNFTGVDPATGLPTFKDINGDGNVTTSDYSQNAAWIGTSRPTIWGGMTNTVSYKGFTLDLFLQFTDGLFTTWYYATAFPNGSMINPSSDVVGNYWMKPGDVTKYPRLYTGVSGTSAYIQPITSMYNWSSAHIYKSYYIRLKNIQLSYNLPANVLAKLKLNNAMVYITAENLAVYCPVKLFKDPELTSPRGMALTKSFTTGIRLTF